MFFFKGWSMVSNAGRTTKSALLLEPFIAGKFTKWHLNDGTILEVVVPALYRGHCQSWNLSCTCGKYRAVIA